MQILCCYSHRASVLAPSKEQPRSELSLLMAGALATAIVPTVAAVVAPVHAVRANSNVARVRADEPSESIGNGHRASDTDAARALLCRLYTGCTETADGLGLGYSYSTDSSRSDCSSTRRQS